MTVLTKAQRLALYDVWVRARKSINMPCNHAMFMPCGHSCTVYSPTYLQFRRTASYSHLMGCVMVPYAGMILGIEHDGYTHS